MAYLRLVRDVTVTHQDPEDPCSEVFEREVDYVLRTLWRLGANAQEVDDLCQEVYLALRHTWARYDVRRPIRPYLFGLVFRVMITYRRQSRREIPRALVELEDVQSSPDTALAAKQDRALLLAALEHVPLPRRAVLVMHDFDDVPMLEIASTLSVPRFTAYSRLRKARRELAAAVIALLAPRTER
jgi:RNA polymerase sigma factor (sigma-70 family)